MVTSPKTALNFRTAVIMAAGITILLNVLIMVSFFFGRDAVMPPPEAGRMRPPSGGEMIVTHIIGNFIIGLLLYVVAFAFLRRREKRGGAARMLAMIVTVVLCAAVASYLISLLQINIRNLGPYPQKFIRGSMLRDIFIAVMVLLSSQLLYISQKQQHTALENESLRAENIRTRFMALRNQMDPHFLFNSLNTLSSLIRTAPSKAEDYVQQLSYVLRYTLQSKEVITLKEELDFTAAYCTLMQIRYGASLSIGFDTDSAYDLWQVVPLSIQTLVENAIKHNVVSRRQPLAITIATHGENVVVSNRVQLKKESPVSGGIGLLNMSERYRLMWKREIAVRNVNGTFEVTIPLIQP